MGKNIDIRLKEERRNGKLNEKRTGKIEIIQVNSSSKENYFYKLVEETKQNREGEEKYHQQKTKAKRPLGLTLSKTKDESNVTRSSQQH